MTIRSICLSSSSRQVEAACTRAVPSSSSRWPRSVFAEALRLLADLLQHEVRRSRPARSCARSQSIWLTGLSMRVGLEVAHPVAVAGEDHHLAVVEVDHRAGVLQQRRGVGGDEVLVLADAHQQRRALAGRHQHARLVGRDDGEAVGAVDVAQRRGHRLLEVALVELADQVRQHLGVGLGGEGVAARLERLPDGVRVLDDAVVDDGDPAGLVGVGMGVRRGGRAVRGPAGVADAERARRAISSCSACSSTRSLPAAFTILRPSPLTTAMPAES